ncbi:2TM domain-containing protein [Mesonia maritima]|uniref:Histidine kinase n=1 Tax=Mesonia maritima TaxID=1793873 RepID=A0ABU1K5F1_9FLAO|nr:2TM domain-containing protein [Mesonia maritima]MDR6300845.1 hypothetical protein [Mesonia maritima]
MSFKPIIILTRVALIVTLIIVVLRFVFSGFKTSILLDFEGMFINFMYAFVLTVVNFLYFFLLEKKLDWSTQGRLRFIVGVAGSILLTTLAFGLCRFFHVVIVKEKYNFSEFLAQESISTYFFPLLLSTIVSLFFHAFYFYKEIQDNKVTEQKIIAGTASAKFDALKNQLDPHFLFNSLNVLSALIDENPNAAQKFTASLSKVYRYVLEQKNKELVSLEEELRFAEVYLSLLKTRFENSIQCVLPKKLNNPEAKIVPLSLQLLLENAVKHNVVSVENPLRIEILEENDVLIIKNNLQKKSVIQKGVGVGLKNIQQRYELLTSRKVSINSTKKSFEIQLPLLTKIVGVVDKKEINQSKLDRMNKYSIAQNRVKEEKEFYNNLTAYVIVIPFLFFVNYMSNGLDFLWFLFPAFGWGFGVAYHYMETFDKNPFFSKKWEERKIKEFLNNDKK